MNIEAASPEKDFPRIVHMINDLEPGSVDLAMLMKAQDEPVPGRLVRRMVARDDNGVAVGYSGISRETWYAPNEYYLWVTAMIGKRGAGMGAALYDEAVGFVRSLGGTTLMSEVRDNDPVSLGFATRRGLAIDRHTFESELDIGSFDEAPFRATSEATRLSGIEMTSLALAGDTRKNRRLLHEVNYATALDVPGAQGWMSFDEFDQRICGATWFQPAGQLVAVAGGRWVGLCAVRLRPELHDAYNLMTGVMKDYRGRGIALALKLHAIRYAKENGAKRISTHNDSMNAPMLALNRRLGYKPHPGKFLLRGVIK
jgi:GNAT superfamily N-acetyltransferase